MGFESVGAHENKKLYSSIKCYMNSKRLQILFCDFMNGTEPVLLVGVDIIIFDIGLFHSLWGIESCVAQHLDGGYGRCVWCICHTLAFLICLPFAFISRPRPYYLWPLLIQQSAYGVGLLILSLAALPRVLPTFTGDQNSASVLSVLIYAIGVSLNFFLLYIYWHWYWHVEAMWDSARKLRPDRVILCSKENSRKKPFKHVSTMDVSAQQNSTSNPSVQTQCVISRPLHLGLREKTQKQTTKKLNKIQKSLNGNNHSLQRLTGQCYQEGCMEILLKDQRDNNDPQQIFNQNQVKNNSSNNERDSNAVSANGYLPYNMYARHSYFSSSSSSDFSQIRNKRPSLYKMNVPRHYDTQQMPLTVQSLEGNSCNRQLTRYFSAKQFVLD
ncbi:unnamed protein product [Thelazia callipaeda]|uniref:G_PROTEIN_RECEP_F2_4 domain-containing protein n=1 Tax=Thelazia callipaeda TaxID=103827 RepID=A0A0N5DC28_THECL|nr:unnamed protein product [Thelazia callipaeda]